MNARLRGNSVAWSLPDDSVLGILGEKPEPGTRSQLGERAHRPESLSTRTTVEARQERSAECVTDHLKKGLVAEWGDEAAAVLQQAMLFDTLDIWDSELVLAPGGRRVLLFAPSDAGPWFDALLPASFALTAASRRGYGPVPASVLQRRTGGRCIAHRRDRFRLTHGRSDDRGQCVSLPGRSRPRHRAGNRRRNIPDRSSRFGTAVFRRHRLESPERPEPMVDRLKDTGLSLSLLPPWYRINQSNDVRMLAGHIHGAALRGLGSRHPARRTIDREGMAGAARLKVKTRSAC